MADLNREFGRAWTALANADDSDRAGRIRAVAGLFRFSQLAGCNVRATDRLTADVLYLLADVEDVVAGRIGFRSVTDTSLEASLGPVLNRMALTRDAAARAAMLGELALELNDDDTVETLACMPYAEHRSGWTAEESWPSERTLRGFVQALGVAWRARRAA